MRLNNRLASDLRPIQFTRHFTRYAEGSVLVEFGETKIICTASISDKIPPFIKSKTQGWVTAEYSMLPRATHSRSDREAAKGKQSGRTLEIQRLIARSLRSAVNLDKLGPYSITVDCDVIQADGGTRTAAITGGCIALYDAIAYLVNKKALATSPFMNFVASVSVGKINEEVRLDLNYEEDSSADTDMNVVMNDAGGFIEIQGTAENKPFSPEDLTEMLSFAKNGIDLLINKQKACLGL